MRQGPGALPAALVDRLELALAGAVTGLRHGEHGATGLGPGTELAQVRPYAPGDDVRHLDAAASARTGAPHVRAHVPERELTTWLVLDRSPSMAWGTGDRLKADVADGVALVAGRLATRRAGRLGVVRFGAGPLAVIPAQAGRAAGRALAAAVAAPLGADGAGAGTLAAALGRVGSLARRRALVLVVSDFRDAGDWPAALRALATRHAVLAVEVGDRREDALPDVGHVWLRDPESGRRLLVDTGRRELREAFAAAARDERAAVAAALRRAGAGHVALATDGDWLATLARVLRGQRPPPPGPRPAGGAGA